MKKNITGLFTALLFLVSYGCGAPPAETEILYLGTASEEGLYVLEFDREARTFSEIQRITDKPGPGFQWIHPNGEVLYSISGEGVEGDENNGSVAAYRIDQETGKLSLINMRSSQGRGPAHVSADPHGRFVYVSNYGGGNLASYPIREDGGLGEVADVVQHEGSSVDPRRQQSAYVHSTIPSPDGRFIYVSDLGTDKIMIYAVDFETGQLTAAVSPYADVEPGSGPRHFRFHPTLDYAYSVEELSNTVTAFRFDSRSGALESIQRIEMLPDDFDEVSWAADIHISPNGNFLYATNRGHDSLAIYEIDASNGQLNLIGFEPTRGGHPRNFGIDRNGDFLFMTNRDDDNLVLFELDQNTGLLTYTGVEVQIPRAICVTQHFLP